VELELEYSLETLPVIARELLAYAGDTRLFLFYAPMGAGKTTIIKELCKALGSKDNFSSPTFSIINEYVFPGGKIFHFDLYRLKNLDELLDLGFEDYLASNPYVFIEWPELAEEIIGEHFVKISVKTEGNIRYLHAVKF
jgi:tRNA threonylcarbamoyladenosine biosynthesis protein TsaE